MKRNCLHAILTVLILTLLLSSCGNKLTPAPVATQTQQPASPTLTTTPETTPDPCLPPQIEAEVQKVQRHMREFDDASTLASSVGQAQLNESIADLQRIRREAEDEQVPACLTDLRKYQIEHMNSVISTLIAFMRSRDPLAMDCVDIQSNTEEAAVCNSIALARQQHDQYLLELARVLGLTVVPAGDATISTPSETPAP